MKTHSSRLVLGILLGGLLGTGTAVAGDAFYCPDGAKPDVCVNPDGKFPVSPTLWPDVCSPHLSGWTPTQGGVDQYSWRTFAALAWPAKAGQRGVPDPAAMPGQKSGKDYLPTVWETWKGITEVFDYSDPTWKLAKDDWNKPAAIPAACKGKKGHRVIQMTSKARRSTLAHTGDGMVQSVNQAGTGPLVDRNGKLVHYEILIDRTMFDDIVDKQAWNKTPDQLNCKNQPTGCVPFQWSVGAMEVKAAWKELDKHEKKSGRFFVRDLLVYIPADPKHKVKESCEPATMGLVGFHIASKTPFSSSFTSQYPTAASWFWPTFEHQDNSPPASGPEKGVDYSFFDASCKPKVTPAECYAAAGNGQNSTPNPDPKFKCCENLFRWQAVGPDGASIKAKRTANQVTQIDPPTPEATTCNSVYRAAAGIKGTIWARYALTDAQWPKLSEIPGPPTTTPAYVRNSAIESFMAQWNKNGATITQANTSSCMGCHNFGVDMSFVFSAAMEETGGQ